MSVGENILPLLRPLPPQLAEIKNRIESLGYVVLDQSSPEMGALSLVSPPRLALMPISSRTTLRNMREALDEYRERFSTGVFRVVGIYCGKLFIGPSDLEKIEIESLFQSPIEDEEFLNQIFEISPISTDIKSISLDHLVQANIVQLEKIQVAPFDIFLYLPANRRAVLYLKRDTLIDEKVLAKFKNNQRFSLYIRRSELADYQGYARKIIVDFRGEESLSDTAKSRKAGARLGEFMSGFFSDTEFSEEQGRTLLGNLKELVSGLNNFTGESLRDGAEGFSFKKLDTATHGQNVSAYCAMFGMSLGLTNLEALKIGGLLHDFGKTELGSQVTTSEGYQQHPTVGVESVSRKKLQIPPEALEMILDHHEHTDGSGFPGGKRGRDISPYAKVCAFANEFDKLTSLRPGFPQLTPLEAFRRISGLDGGGASPIYDPEFHAPLMDLFLPKSITSSEDPIPDKSMPEDSKAGHDVARGIANVGTGGKFVSIERLLKTDQFKQTKYSSKPEYKDPQVAAEMAEIEKQLTAHFARS